MTTKREMEQRARYYAALQSLGFTYDECEQLRRISMTLRRWHELECGDGNGCIERDEVNGRPYWRSSTTDRRYPVADRETGAKKRLASIIAERNKRQWHPIMPEAVVAYIQGDPRGAALYILRPGDVPDFDGWAVWCKDDDGNMTRATRQEWRRKEDAIAYMNTVALARSPELRQVPADPGAYYSRGICVF